jgi:hypothetical protein
MKHTAALHTLVTALILFVAAGSLFSADQQKRTTLIAQSALESSDVAARIQDMAALDGLDRDERTLVWIAIVAAGFLVSALVLYLVNDSVLGSSEAMANRIQDVVANPGGSNAATEGGLEIRSIWSQTGRHTGKP